MFPRSVVKAGLATILVPRPQTAVVGGRPIAGVPLLEWARTVIDAVIDPPTANPHDPKEKS
jgi:transcription-repair coupling factor (superfamily II helicase)